MSIAQYIIYLDNMRLLCMQGFEQWKSNQNLAKGKEDRDYAIFCKNQAEYDYERWRYYTLKLLKIGVDTRNWAGFTINDILINYN